MTAPSNIYLGSYLCPLSPYLDRDDVTDIVINRTGELWFETINEGFRRVEVPELTDESLLLMARQIAALSAQGISRQHPLLSANLPSGERVQIVIPPATRAGVAMAIRKHIVSKLSLEEFRFTADVMGIAAHKRKADRFAFDSTGDDDPVSVLKAAVRSKKNILVSGGTASGKTTLLRSLIDEIDESERLILLEDAPEIEVRHANHIGLVAARGTMTEADVSMNDLLVAALRMRPDRILLGEIRGIEAVSFLRAVNTGHPGSLSTIHADSPDRAIDQLALLTLQSGMRMSWENVVEYVRHSIDIIVQMGRGPNGREIQNIKRVC